MSTEFDYKRLYELCIVEKEKLIEENNQKQDIINNLLHELNTYKINNYSKKSYYEKNKQKIIEKIKEYNKHCIKDPEKIKEYNKRSYEKRKIKQNIEKTNSSNLSI